MFDDFTLEHVDVGEVTLRVRHDGEGQPVVLLHGHPRTHTTWHRVAPRLAESLRVVCPDLRGYGQSMLPPDAPDHAQSSKRAMAHDVVSLMRHLGHDRFAVVGHDRGSLVAFRTPIDIHGDPEAIWRSWVAGELRSTPIHSGHHQAEQAPDELAQALLEFLAASTAHSE